MRISNGRPHIWYKVMEFEAEPVITRRLEALGITEGSKLQILNKKKNGSIIIKIRGTRWAIGKKISEGIICREETNGKGN